MLRLAVLISGGGTDLQSIIDAHQRNEIDCEMALVISNRESAYGLERAQKAGIPTAVIKDQKEGPEGWDPDSGDQGSKRAVGQTAGRKNRFYCLGRILGHLGKRIDPSLSQQDHQYSSFSDPVFLRTGHVWTACA